jgi:hypothetical protein
VAEFEHSLIRERTVVGVKAAGGRAGGNPGRLLDGVRRECGQQDGRQAHEQETTDALEQDDGTAFS